MEKIFVEKIRERDVVETVFLVRDKTLAMAKNGKPYLTLKLMDRTGELEGRIWDNADYISGLFAKDDFVLVQGKASLYLGKMQLIVQSLECQDESLVDLADFLPVSKFPVAELQAKLKEKVATISENHFRQLMELFLADQEFLAMYSAAPAAKTMHHVFLGGLLEHSLAVADLAEDICVSTGSACAANNSAPSSVLRAIGLSDEEIDCSIRVSFGRNTASGDVEFAVKKMIDATIKLAAQG